MLKGDVLRTCLALRYNIAPEILKKSFEDFWILDFGFWILDFGFWIFDFRFPQNLLLKENEIFISPKFAAERK